MPTIKMNISAEHKLKFEAEAAKYSLPLSLWMRSTLLTHIRAVAAPVGRPRKYKWMGVECSKEEYEAGMEKVRLQTEKRNAELERDTQPINEELNKLMEFDENGDPKI